MIFQIALEGSCELVLHCFSSELIYLSKYSFGANGVTNKIMLFFNELSGVSVVYSCFTFKRKNNQVIF